MNNKKRKDLKKIIDASELRRKIETTYKEGDKIQVRQDDGAIAEWTYQYAGFISNQCCIWCLEHRGGYSAERIIF